MPTTSTSINLDFNDQRLKYLYVSHQLGSMRAAADELGMAPSSISRQIAKLEMELGIDLVEEGTHRMRLTEAGQATVDYYATRAGQHHALLEQLDTLRGRLLGTTVVALGEGLLGANAILQLKRFYGDYPEARTDIVIAPSAEIQRMVLEDRAHIGAAFCPTACANMRRHYSFSHPLYFVTHPLGPMASRTRVTLSDLAHTSLVLPDQKYRLRQLFDQACHERGIDVVPRITSNSLQVMLDFVQGGIASTLLTEVQVASELRRGKLKLIPLDAPELTHCETQIFTRQSRKLSPLSRELITFLAKAFQAPPAADLPAPAHGDLALASSWRQAPHMARFAEGAPAGS